MNRGFLKQFAMFFTFLLVFVNLSFVQPDTSSAKNLEQAVTITALDKEGTKVLSTAAVAFDDGETAWDVLKVAADDLTYDESDFGPMLTGVNGVDSDFDKDQTYWSFIVNGKAASVGASSYDLSSGDNILFYLTDDKKPLTDVTVSAKGEKGKFVLKETTVQLAPFSSAYDAIVQAAKQQEVSLDVTVHSDFFTFINNVGDQEIDDNDWWELSSNDSPLEVGALSHQVQPGEHIQLKLQSFTTDDDEEDSDSDKDEEKPEKDEEDNSSNKDEQENESNNVTKQALQEVDFLANYVIENKLATEFGNEWWVWGLGKASNKVPSSYEKSIRALVAENKGEFGNVFDLEKIIIALSTSGVDATSIEGINLIDKLSNHKSLNDPLINAAIYALIAANSGEYEMDEKTEEKLVNLILSSEIDGGGWAFFGNKPGADMTGMALTALANYQDRTDVKGAIDRAVSLLAKEQADNGGFYEEINGGYTSEAVSQVIIGLVSVGVNPTNSQFTKGGTNLIQHLLEYKTSEGLYSHILDTNKSDIFLATPQAFLALAYYVDFVQPDGNEQGKPKPEDKEEGTQSQNNDDNNGPGESNKGEIVPPKKNNTIKNENETNDKVKTTGEKLPKTSTNIFNLLGLGLLVLTAGFVFLVLQRRWKTTS